MEQWRLKSNVVEVVVAKETILPCIEKEAEKKKELKGAKEDEVAEEGGIKEVEVKFEEIEEVKEKEEDLVLETGEEDANQEEDIAEKVGRKKCRLGWRKMK